MRFMNGRYGVIDLASGESSEHELSEDAFRGPSSYLSAVGSAAREHAAGGLAVSSGLLTCSLTPAACAGFVLSPREGPAEERMCPLTGYIGTELKLSGFDFIVLAGESKVPGYIWIRDGILELVPSPAIVGSDSWKRTDTIRKDQGDKRIQVISVGPWGDSCLASSQLVMNYWGGEDAIGCAADFGRRSVAAFAVRGMGEIELEEPEEHFSRSLELRESHRAALGESTGLSSFTEKVAGEGFGALFHRKVACYGCPYPCRSYYKVFEDADVMALKIDEPGHLAYDIPAIDELLSIGLTAREVVLSLIACAKAGADPVSVARAVGDGGPQPSVEAIQAALASEKATDARGSAVEGGFTDAFANASDYVVCLALGLCPRYWARVGLNFGAISRVAEPATGSGMELR
ncbi:MAG: hypothetical protein JSV90_05990 [Methanobacteriota archaeon]|nr:MAG: hypothetical protein JSV90_05990 [Euryarchaeota archaeon]